MARRHEQQKENLSALLKQRDDAAALYDQLLNEAAEGQERLQRAIEQLQQRKQAVEYVLKKKYEAKTELKQLRGTLEALVEQQNLSGVPVSLFLSLHLPQHEHAEAFKLLQLHPVEIMDQLQLQKEYAFYQQRKDKAKQAKHRQHEVQLAPLLKRIKEVYCKIQQLHVEAEAGLEQEKEAEAKYERRCKEAAAKQKQAKKAEAQLQGLKKKIAAKQDRGGVGQKARPRDVGRWTGLTLESRDIVPIGGLLQKDMARGVLRLPQRDGVRGGHRLQY